MSSEASRPNRLDQLFYDYTWAQDDEGAIDPRLLTSFGKEYTNEVTPEHLVPVPRGFFFPYQEQQARYMLQHGKNKQLGILDPGTGKTFIATMISEMLRGNYNPSLPRDERIDAFPPVVRQYLSPSRPNIKRLIYLTANHVLDRQALEAVPIIKNTASMSISDKEWYISRTFGVFLTEYSATYKRRRQDIREEIKDKFQGAKLEQESMRLALEEMSAVFERDLSDSLVVVDEAHRLVGQNLDKIASGENVNYILILTLIRSIKRSKVVVFTATPMNNSTNEAIPVLNLVLEQDEQISLDVDFDKMKDDEVQTLIREKMGDKTFYVTSKPTGMNPVYEGVYLPGTPFSYDPVEMVGKQQEQYLRVVRGEYNDVKISGGEEKGDSSKKEKETSYLLETVTELCWSPIREETTSSGKITKTKKTLDPIIYPQDSQLVKDIAKDLEARTLQAMVERATKSGKEEKNATRRLGEKYTDTVRIIVDAVPYIFDAPRMLQLYGEKPENWMLNGPRDNNLRQRSAKYHQILSTSLSPKTGNVVFLVYFRYLVNGGLQSFVAIALLNGYERYDDTLKDVVVGSKIVGLTKKKRLIVLTPSMKSATKELWLRIVAHPDNVNGEYINMVIISPGMKIGISVFSVRYVFHTSPEWSPWGEIQSIYRGLREGGAEEVLKSLGEWPNGVMDVIISLQCAILSKSYPRSEMIRARIFAENLPVDKVNLTTVDQDMYLWLADKYKRHLRVLGPLRDVAVGGYLNALRNFPTANPPPRIPGPVITNSFNVLYTGKYVWALKTYMRRMLEISREPIHYADILAQTRAYNIPLHCYDRAISELVMEKDPIMSETGYPLYISFDRDRLYVQQEYPIGEEPYPEQDFLLSYYSNYTPIFHAIVADEPVFNFTEDKKKALLANKTISEMRDYIKKRYKTVDEQMTILETALLETYKQKNFEKWKSGEWGILLQIYEVYWKHFSGLLFKNARIVHSFVSFWHEAGYPIVARLQRPSRFRYWSETSNEWATTTERSSLVQDFRTAYSDAQVEKLFKTVSELPIAIDTVCDGQFRVVIRRADTGPGIRGKMIGAYTSLELVYIALLVQWSPQTSSSEKKYSIEDIDAELREEVVFSFGEDEAPVVEELIVDLANTVYASYTREEFASELKNEFERQNRVILA